MLSSESVHGVLPSTGCSIRKQTFHDNTMSDSSQIEANYEPAKQFMQDEFNYETLKPTNLKSSIRSPRDINEALHT